jgi:uncharacterized DUF497 family protein
MFEWDDANLGHIGRHGVSPQEVEQVIENEPYELGYYVENGETRSSLLGETAGGRLLMVVITERGDWIRPVTAYPPGAALLKLYRREEGKPR